MNEAMTREQLAAALGRVGGGDRAAFARVYEATSAKLMGVVLRILPDRQTAEDVLQDAYLTVWRKAETFDPGRASPITWLVTIARNRAIDRLRSGARQRTSADMDQAMLVEDERPTPAQAAESRDEARRLYGCLGELDERANAAVRTAFMRGFTYQQLAERDGVPLGTMKSVIRRALIRLRACLER